MNSSILTHRMRQTPASYALARHTCITSCMSVMASRQLNHHLPTYVE